MMIAADHPPWAAAAAAAAVCDDAEIQQIVGAMVM
jgi:hypothetical protein